MNYTLNQMYKLSFAICVLIIFYAHSSVAQSGIENESYETSYKDSFATNVNQGSYFQFGLYYCVSMPLGSYHEITKTRGGSPDFQSAYMATFDQFWNNIGFGVETGFFSHKYERAPYSDNVAQYEISWEKEKWSSLFFGIGPTFSMNSGADQYQIAFRTGIMRTNPPVYKAFYTISHPDLLEFEYPGSTLVSPYGSISLKGNYIISKNFTFSISFSYIGSFGKDYIYHHRELIDYDGNGWYSDDEARRSPFVDKSLKVKPEIFTFGLGINYRFQ